MVSSWSWLVFVAKGSCRMGGVVKRDGMDGIDGELDMTVLVDSGVGVFLMRREASPQYCVVAASDEVDGRVLCGSRIFRRDFPDAATIGMRLLIDLNAIGCCGGDVGLELVYDDVDEGRF